MMGQLVCDEALRINGWKKWRTDKKIQVAEQEQTTKASRAQFVQLEIFKHIHGPRRGHREREEGSRATIPTTAFEKLQAFSSM